MKILQVAYSDHGGAGLAAKRLNDALLSHGYNSTLLVLDKKYDGSSVIKYSESKGILFRILRKIRYIKDKKIRKDISTKRPKGFEGYSLIETMVGNDILRFLEGYDVINMHWISNFLDICLLKKISKKAKLVWTMHDMYPFTGVCHYAWDCDKYLESCGKCPQLGSEVFNDVAYKSWNKKRKIYRSVKINFVSPSNWLKQCAMDSSLIGDMAIESIPNSLGAEDWNAKRDLKDELGLDKNKKYVLAGAVSLSNTRKGYIYINEFIDLLDKNDVKDVEVLIFGKTQSKSYSNRVRYLGALDNKILKNYYLATDFFLLTSLYDNLPNTVLEAMAAGSIVMAYDVGGVGDLVKDAETGILVPVKKIEQIVERFVLLLSKPQCINEMSTKARERVRKLFSPELQVKKYVKIYEGVK